ncbi:MAG: topology modulation protein [Parvibaculum sp.]
MKRVLVIGPSGAGKSTFATALAARTGLPLIHLDQQYWKPGWVETPEAEWLQKVEGLVARDTWIMEGGYSASFHIRMPRADTIFLITRPRWLYIARVLLRTLKHYGRVRPDLAEGCPERFDLDFLKWVWNYEKRSLPSIYEGLRNFGGQAKLITIASDQEGADYLARLRSKRISASRGA